MNTQMLIDFMQRLVRQPSPSGEEQAVVQIVINEMQSLGFDKIRVDENGSAIGIIEGMQRRQDTSVRCALRYRGHRPRFNLDH